MFRDIILYIAYFLIGKWQESLDFINEFDTVGAVNQYLGIQQPQPLQDPPKGNNGKYMINGYWENWNPALSPRPSSGTSDPNYYVDDFKPNTHIFYSFLTLAKVPNPYTPQQASWDGKAIYESMTQADILQVLEDTDPHWKNDYYWQKVKIVAMMEACKRNNQKFIWATGGWSDLTQTISSDQVDLFVEKAVALLKMGGDGIDFDWEHLSSDLALRDNQIRNLASILNKLRKSLDANDMHEK